MSKKLSELLKNSSFSQETGGRAASLLNQLGTKGLAGALVVPVNLLVANPRQIRQDYTSEGAVAELAELAADLAERGILEPLLVRVSGQQQYELIAGERRYRAAKMAGLVEVPVIVKEVTEQEADLIMLVENVQRKDLSPQDEQLFYQRLQAQYNLGIGEIAGLIHKSESYVRRRLAGQLVSLKSEAGATKTQGDESTAASDESESTYPKAETKAYNGKRFARFSRQLTKELDEAIDWLDREPPDAATLAEIGTMLTDLQHRLTTLTTKLGDKSSSE